VSRSPAAAPDLLLDPPPCRCGLVVNPLALRNSRRPRLLRLLRERFAPLGECFMIDPERNLTDVLTRWREEGIEMVAISGGDGTIHLIVDEIIRLWAGHPLPCFLFLHGGTTGFVARETGTAAAGRVSARLAEACAQNRPIPARYVDTLTVGERHVFCFGLGIFRTLSLEYITRGGLAGLSHILLGLRFAGSWATGGNLARRALQPLPWRIVIDSEEIPPEHFVGLFAAGLPSLKIFRAYQAIPCPTDSFRLVGIQPAGALTLLRGIRPVISGNAGSLPSEIRLQGIRELRVEGQAGERVPYMADGEYYSEPERLIATKGPRLTVLLPDLITA